MGAPGSCLQSLGVTVARGNGHVIPWLDICLVMGCYLPLGHQQWDMEAQGQGKALWGLVSERPGTELGESVEGQGEWRLQASWPPLSTGACG